MSASQTGGRWFDISLGLNTFSRVSNSKKIFNRFSSLDVPIIFFGTVRLFCQLGSFFKARCRAFRYFATLKFIGIFPKATLGSSTRRHNQGIQSLVLLHENMGNHFRKRNSK